MIVDNALYRDGHRVHCTLPVDDLAGLRSLVSQPGDFVWTGLLDPSAIEMESVARVYGLHPLAVADATRPHQRPKLERYNRMLFLVMRTLWYVDDEDAVETGQIALFIGEDFVVSVRHGPGTPLTEARQHLEEGTGGLQKGPSAVVYAICDQVVAHYAEVATSLTEDVDEVEASVFGTERSRDTERIYVLKRELAEMRRAVQPLRDPLDRFAQGAAHGIDIAAAEYFRNVGDHLKRIAETVDGLDDLLSTAFDASLAQISVQQNDDMRKISAAVGLVAAPTLIAGIYGMNFRHMPELHWMLGYPFALLLMVLSSTVVWIIARRSGWL